jgi:hypothetical protein
MSHQQTYMDLIPSFVCNLQDIIGIPLDACITFSKMLFDIEPSAIRENILSALNGHPSCGLIPLSFLDPSPHSAEQSIIDTVNNNNRIIAYYICHVACRPEEKEIAEANSSYQEAMHSNKCIFDIVRAYHEDPKYAYY